jgi:hypothetical protein
MSKGEFLRNGTPKNQKKAKTIIRNAFFANRNASGSCAGLRTFVEVFPFLPL